MPEIPFAATLIVCLTAGAALRVSAGTVRWARIRRRRASPSHLASTAQNRLCASFPRSPDHHFPEFWFKTRDTQTIHRASVPLYSLLLVTGHYGATGALSLLRDLICCRPFSATTRVQIETTNGCDFADEQARAKAASAGHTATWKTGSKHVRRCQRNGRDLSVRQ